MASNAQYLSTLGTLKQANDETIRLRARVAELEREREDVAAVEAWRRRRTDYRNIVISCDGVCVAWESARMNEMGDRVAESDSLAALGALLRQREGR